MRKNRLLFIYVLVALALIVSLVAAGCQSASEQKKVKLVFNTHDRPTTPQSEATLWYFDELNKRTGNLIEWDLHWSGELAGGADELSSLRGGAVDVAAPPPAYTPNDTPLLQIVNSTRVPNSTAVAMRQGLELFWRSGEVSDILDEEAKANNVKLLMWCPMEYSLVSRPKITSIADFDGLKMRSVGIFEPKLLSSYGAIPVSVLPAEWYEALARGTIDAIPMVNEAIVSFRLHEVGDFKSFHCGAIMSNPIMINLDSYAKLPRAVQKLMDDVDFREEATEEFIKIWEAGTEVAMSEMAAHLEFVEVSSAEQQRLWDDWVQVTVDEFPGAAENAGKGEEGIKVLDRWLELVTGKGYDAWK